MKNVKNEKTNVSRNTSLRLAMELRRLCFYICVSVYRMVCSRVHGHIQQIPPPTLSKAETPLHIKKITPPDQNLTPYA